MATTSSNDFYSAKKLVFEILSWLPVKSLLLFKSVCKSWFSRISSPAFIETHLINTKNKPSSLIWLSEADSGRVYDAVTILNVDEPVRINLPRNLITTTRYLHSCNGLVFQSNMYPKSLHDNVSFIWNPLTKNSKMVPAKKHGDYQLGFGFDSISNDYKILRVEYDLWSFGSVVGAELYSVNDDSWKEIQVSDALRSFNRPLLRSEFVHVDGVLYLESDKELLAFDLHSEVFGLSSFPNSLHYTRRSRVLDYEGSVAMIFKGLDGGESDYSLWILDDGSWTKKFSLDLEADQYWVHLYLGAGQFVAEDYNSEYIIYDHINKQMKKFSLPFLADKFALATYNESLVSIKGFEHEK